ncbi:MAG: site-2 protease family protein [Bacillota bacterium]
MNTLLIYAIEIPAILIALTFHEYMHGRVAYALGDPTPKNQGRLTLNPIRHLDPLGSLLLLLVGFGWAKPVEVNPFHFKGDRGRGMLWVSLAGPGTNLVLAVLAAVAWRLTGGSGTLINFFFQYLFQINVVLAVFNLLPVPPLDGSKILAGLLPMRHRHIIYNIERYGTVILLLLVITGFIRIILMPLVGIVMQGINGFLSLFF